MAIGLIPVRVDAQDRAQLRDRLGVATGATEHLRPREARLEQPRVELDRVLGCLLRAAERVGILGSSVDAEQGLAAGGVGQGEVRIEREGAIAKLHRALGSRGIVCEVEVPAGLQVSVVGFRILCRFEG